MKMSKLTWNSPSAAMEHIVTSLKKNASGLTENKLNTKHDPVLISRGLDLLLSRKAIDIFYDESKVGSERKLYKIRG